MSYLYCLQGRSKMGEGCLCLSSGRQKYLCWAVQHLGGEMIPLLWDTFQLTATLCPWKPLQLNCTGFHSLTALLSEPWLHPTVWYCSVQLIQAQLVTLLFSTQTAFAEEKFSLNRKKEVTSCFCLPLTAKYGTASCLPLLFLPRYHWFSHSLPQFWYVSPQVDYVPPSTGIPWIVFFIRGIVKLITSCCSVWTL